MEQSGRTAWVPGAQAADFDDDQLVAALPDSPFRAEIPARLRRAHALLHDPSVKSLP